MYSHTQVLQNMYIYMRTGYIPFQEFIKHTTKREPVSSEGILNTFLDNLRSHVAMCATEVVTEREWGKTKKDRRREGGRKVKRKSMQ